jgi:hypothetical protein
MLGGSHQLWLEQSVLDDALSCSGQMLPEAVINCIKGESHGGLVKQQPDNLLLYLLQEGEKKRGQATEVCQSHKGNGHSPLGRLGKHGIREGSKVVHHRRDRPLPGRFYIESDQYCPRTRATTSAIRHCRERVLCRPLCSCSQASMDPVSDSLVFPGW